MVETFGSYFSRFWSRFHREATPWARDNILWGVVVLISPPIAVFLSKRNASLDWVSIRAAFWLYVVTLLIYVFAHCWRTAWELDNDRIIDVSNALGQRTQAEEREAAARKEIYNGRPLFVFQVIGQPQWTKPHPTGEFIFRLHNCGERTARYIELETQTSFNKHFHSRFDTIPVLIPQQHVPVGYSVNDQAPYIAGSYLDQNMLWKFLNDVGDPEKEKLSPLERAALIWFDIKISYRDMNEAPGTDVARMCFDVSSGYLYATEVPYTRNPPPGPIKLLPL